MKTILTASIALVGFFVWLGCGHVNKTNTANYNPKSYNRSLSSTTDLTAPWAYDPGPSPDTKMGRELIDLVATQPNMPGISMEMTGDQKFRPAFGPTLWRMIQEPNSIKMLFIGQDGTHIAEAAGRTATAGFGGRAQDMAAYFGVDTSAAFINTFAFTIKGQYSAYQAPVVYEENGESKLVLNTFQNEKSLGTTVVENGIWMMAQDLNSPMVKWRNSLIDWIIRNNRDSLRMIVVFGDSAQDSIGTFITSRGGKVGSMFSVEDIRTKKIRVPEFAVVAAGANHVFPTVVDQNGKDLYPKIAGRRLDYTKDPDQKAAKDALIKNFAKVKKDLSYPTYGIENSGIMNPAQINGYDLNKIEINGKRTLSLKGLQLSDGSTIPNDVLVAEFPHPTSLSSSEMTSPGSASKKIAASLKNIIPYKAAGWKIEADPGKENQFDAGKPYTYGRTDISRSYYDFGTPNNRMVSKSDAVRGKANFVILGTRDKVPFDTKSIALATVAKPNQPISQDEFYSARPRTEASRYSFDRGPGEVMARIMKENINMKDFAVVKSGYKLKPGVKFDPKRDSIEEVADVDAFNIKTHPIAVGDHGHYRGTFDNPRIVILADPAGVDEILTSRALTGTRGQYLQGLMNKLGVPEQYLVIRTVPFGMDNATEQEWSTVLEQTRRYRSEIFAEILRNGTPDMIIADGKYAQKEMGRILTRSNKIPLVFIERAKIGDGINYDNGSGITEAQELINSFKVFTPAKGDVTMANIPRSHFGFFSRVWEGTSGTRVFNTTEPKANGIGFAVVVPEWVYKQQNVKQSREERMGIEKLKGTLQEQHVPMIQENFKRKSMDGEEDAALFFFPGRFDENSLAA